MMTFDDALSTLMAMFGPKYTKEKLEIILRHFEGHMENTVDTILTHGDRNPQELIAQLNKAQSGFDLDEQLAQELGREEEARIQHPAVVVNPTMNSLPPALRRGPDLTSNNVTTTSRNKVELPHEFLRIPGYPHSDVSSTIADDEALARALQNELFMNQIRDDPELSHLSRPRYSNMTTTSGLASRPIGNPFIFPKRPTGVAGGHDGPGFMEALSELGDNAKKKLAILAEKFNASIIKPNLAQGSGGIGGRSGADEGKGLLHRDRDEEELIFSGGGATEMKPMTPTNRSNAKKGD